MEQNSLEVRVLATAYGIVVLAVCYDADHLY